MTDDLANGGMNDLTEFERLTAFQDWLRALQRLRDKLSDLGETVRQACAAWPGMRNVLKQLQCMPIYCTWGPPGSGPGFETAADAAEFILLESRTDAEEWPEPGKEPQVKFTSEDLAFLRRRGDRIEKGGWGIRMSRVRRGWWGMVEWDGF